MNRIYQPFLNKIEKSIGNTTGKFEKSIVSNLSDSWSNLNESTRLFSRNTQVSAVAEETGLAQLAMFLGLPLKTPTLGNHPDFKHIAETNRPEKHYATAVFQDVKGSTSLFRKFSDEQVYTIIQTIAVATTHTHGLFSGHIQRLQYDGVFSYFVQKSISEKLITFNSLAATAFSTYFIRYELKEYFIDQGFDKINVRTGIDYGDNNQVMWVPFGVSGCSEVSTNSLHTSLTFKIQAKASADSICVGANVVNLLPSLTEYFTPHKQPDGTVDSTIWTYENGTAYKYYDFNWEKFLVDTYPDFVKRSGNKIYIDYDADVAEVKRKAALRNEIIMSKLGLGYVTPAGAFSSKPTEIKIPSSGKYGY